MSSVIPVTIINVGYRSTNYWVVSAGTSRLLVDIGWPGAARVYPAHGPTRSIDETQDNRSLE
jgi:glyoxylase-like metal-dependent hydrolase (beta-lactamase superfamily II)